MEETGRGWCGISGSWEPEKETESMTERAFERAAGLSDLAQVPLLANLLALDKISKHSASLRIVREQSQTSQSTSQAPELLGNE